MSGARSPLAFAMQFGSTLYITLPERVAILSTCQTYSCWRLHLPNASTGHHLTSSGVVE